MTQIQSEAKESVVTTEPNFLYCILHEGMVHAEQSACGLGHVVEIETQEGKEIEFCCFEAGYTYCPPPTEIADLPDDWESQPDCLSDDKRALAEVEEMGMWKEGME